MCGLRLQSSAPLGDSFVCDNDFYSTFTPAVSLALTFGQAQHEPASQGAPTPVAPAQPPQRDHRLGGCSAQTKAMTDPCIALETASPSRSSSLREARVSEPLAAGVRGTGCLLFSAGHQNRASWLPRGPVCCRLL